jgi:hypothetical protein
VVHHHREKGAPVRPAIFTQAALAYGGSGRPEAVYLPHSTGRSVPAPLLYCCWLLRKEPFPKREEKFASHGPHGSRGSTESFLPHGKLTQSLEQNHQRVRVANGTFGLHQRTHCEPRVKEYRVQAERTETITNGVYGRLRRPNQQPPGPAYTHSPRPFRYPGRCLHVGGHAPRVCFCLSACKPRCAVRVWQYEWEKMSAEIHPALAFPSRSPT